MPLRVPLVLLVLGAVLAAQSSRPAAGSDNWPGWRGPLDTGFAPHGDPPTVWSEKKNVRWKCPLPGLGHSTPIVWGDRVFVTTAVAHGDEITPERHEAPGAHDNFPKVKRQTSLVIAIDRKTGKILWERAVHDGYPHEGGHNTGSFASASLATDGEHLIAFFGSRGLYGLGLDGKVRWKADLGRQLTKHAHGEGSSPCLHGDAVAINWDHEGESFVAVYDKHTGRERWRVKRNEVTSWATPIVVEADGKSQLIVAGTGRLRGYDLANGEVIWECGGLAHNVVASPVAADGVVYAASSYEKQAMLAVRLAGAKGDLSVSENLLWVRRRRTPYVPSPLLYGEFLYTLHHYQGVMSRVVAKTGKEATRPWRLPGIRNVYASPVAAAGRIYVTGRNGNTLVLAHEAALRTLALNRLDDRFSASPAIAGGELYLRGERSLYCIAAP